MSKEPGKYSKNFNFFFLLKNVMGVVFGPDPSFNVHIQFYFKDGTVLKDGFNVQ